MSARAILLVALTVLFLLNPATADDTLSIPPLGKLHEIDVDFLGSGTLYFTRVFSNGAGTLCFASQVIGWCPARTFDFKVLYEQLSMARHSSNSDPKFEWTAGFLVLNPNAQVQSPVSKGIDPVIVLGILKTFVAASTNKKYMLQRFADSPALPPTQTSELLKAGN
jgi:hypothetical protein